MDWYARMIRSFFPLVLFHTGDCVNVGATQTFVFFSYFSVELSSCWRILDISPPALLRAYHVLTPTVPSVIRSDLASRTPASCMHIVVGLHSSFVRFQPPSSTWGCALYQLRREDRTVNTTISSISGLLLPHIPLSCIAMRGYPTYLIERSTQRCSHRPQAPVDPIRAMYVTTHT
jgi:hypothetical protein